MELSRIKTYEQLKDFLRTFVNWHGDPAPYDFNRSLHLVLAGVENLRVNATDGDFLDYGCAISDDQAAFLRRLLNSRGESIGQLESEP
jgi:hypothetical protein